VPSSLLFLLPTWPMAVQRLFLCSRPSSHLLVLDVVLAVLTVILADALAETQHHLFPYFFPCLFPSASRSRVAGVFD
jgi:hypothetical protein